MAECYDVIVIGAGHAGVEAAWAASRLGADVALITMNRLAVARMSCNPAIGGLGKGQMVREIDALGGLMGLAIDQAGIQFRILNRSKGPAVRAPRAQADREAYGRVVLEMLEEVPSISIIEGSVEAIHTRDSAQNGTSREVSGVALEDGRSYCSKAVIIAAGTFLRALTHCGPEQTPAGRIGEPSADALAKSLLAVGLELGRLKTGTPPRVHRDTIDYSACERQPGDAIPEPFSTMTGAITQPQVDCWITWTSEKTHEPIRANLHRAPMYSGQIQSTGPRYCPSIEDKVVRFADKTRHQVFLEPEGYDSELVYCNGISTSLPTDIQDVIVPTLPGLERARIMQYGYAVEYDFVPTHQIQASLETKTVAGLFLAGQINGTSGYEEAGAQGLIAGVNAVRRLAEEKALVLGREQAYIGVLIDDLITRPSSEPYRMFTSRAEYRLLLRADNADQRLTPIGRRIGTVDDKRWTLYQKKCRTIDTLERLTKQTSVDGAPLATWLRRPDANVEALATALAGVTRETFCAQTLGQVIIDAKYSGYVDRQARQIDRFRRLESLRIPSGVDYAVISGLRLEAREHLARVAPQTLGQASRIPGINPADVTVLWVHLSRRRRSA